MGAIFLLLAAVCFIAHIVCYFIILIDAFQDSVWKGLVGLLCCELYLLYYAIFEFDHQKKGQIVAGWLLGGILASVFMGMSGFRAPGT